jgi:Ca2+-binding EF-hand superfamily protein
MAGPNLEEEELMTLVEQTFRDADLNRDGLLDFEEFSTVKQSPFELTGFYR